MKFSKLLEGPEIYKPEWKGNPPVKFENISVSSELEKEANSVLTKISTDAMDGAKLATISKTGTDGEETIVFEVDFENVESFIGIAKKIKDNPKISVTGFSKGGSSVDSSGNFTKGAAPTNIEKINWMSAPTKNSIYKFLLKLAGETLKENKNKMKNEKDFKKQISEIAARIAEQDGPNKPEPDAQKVQDILDGMSTRLEGPLRAINKASELKQVIQGMMSMMPNMAPSSVASALNTILRTLSKDMAAANQDKGVSKKSKGAMYDKMPIPKDMKGDIPDELEEMSLKETYERIRKK